MKTDGRQQKETGPRMIPVVDLGRCSRCEGCIEIAPEVFRVNTDTACIEVIDLPEYPIDKVNETITYCPEDCISWEH
ncbi:MAG: ferredoxin [Desulfocapsaceae bacterium]|nr:ferredoxin [Desulfocapsaceae bacterium]